ncbi:karyopherin Kap95 [Auricularia subglabra TFB-10046 SS5]|nr:karyopherin Kap95 [Auricularia subglabra TFB-10046 SS5]
MNVASLLSDSLSNDAATRQNATAALEHASATNYPAYMVMLAAELANERGELMTRNAAGIALKNALSARDVQRQQEYEARWLNLPAEPKNQVKQDALRTLASPTRAAGVSAQVIAAIAAVELPNHQWPELIQGLLGYVNDPSNANLRVSALQTIGYICETIRPEVLAMRANEILTAVVHGARKDEPSADVQLAAINALYNSLEFVRENFEREGERNYIMQVVCEATQNPSVPVQVAAFECLVRIMGLYYDKMSFYMERALFGLTVLGMKNPEESVALQAVEFWSTVCEEEIDLSIEEAEAMEYGEHPENESKYFAKIALPEIMPVILQLLTRQEDDADEDEWNVSMAAGTCLGLLSQAVCDAIVQQALPFIEVNIKNPDWHYREAAVMAFGSILDGPDPTALAPLVAQALPIMIDMMRDADIHVRDTTAWTLGRICELLTNTIKPDTHLRPLVMALVAGLEDSPRIVTNCCWSLMNLGDQLSLMFSENEAPPATSVISPYFQGIVEALLRVTERNSNENNFRTSAYEAITTYVARSAVDTLPVVSTVVITVLSRMESLLSVQSELLGADDRNNWNDLQGNLASVVISVTRRLGREIAPLAERIMTIVLQLMQSTARSVQNNPVVEDCFLIAGTLASALERDFERFLPPFIPFLETALRAHEDTQLCTVAIGIVGDIARALGEGSAAYAGGFMGLLLENLRSDVLARSVKIPILACFGDIALATGAHFEPYLDTVVGVLRQAGMVQSNALDYEMLEYVHSLREGILDAYVGIVSGLKPTEKKLILVPHVPAMLDLIQRTLADEERPDSVAKLAIGLLGDIADAFPNGQVKDYLLADWITSALKVKGRARDLKTTVRWAKEMVKRATQ